MECENKSDTGNNRGEWKYFKITEYLSNMPGEHEIKEIQKTAVLGTAHVLRRVLKKHRTYFTGEITLHVAQIVNTEWLRPYIP